MIAALGGLLLDIVAGEPPAAVHPVVGIGRMIAEGERWLRRVFRIPPEDEVPVEEDPKNAWLPVSRRRREKMAGIVLAGSVVGLTWGLTWGSVWLAGRVHPLFGYALSALWAWIAVAPRNLAQAARRVADLLRGGDLPGARRAAGMMVSRSTEDLPEVEVIRATVESVAENIVDAVISPLLYAFVGGGPAAMAYRAANTLDAMVGYRNARYRDFGWASARLDDVLNWIPARLAAAVLFAAALILRLDARGAWRAVRQDARKHPSPNGGFPEAAVAGALGVRFGGWNIYHGRRSFRPYLGPGVRPLEVEDITRTVHIMAWATAETAFLMLLSGGGLRWW